MELDPAIFLIPLKEGVGGIELSTIDAILPDTKAPKSRSLVYTSTFPEGITVEGKCEVLLVEWSMRLGSCEQEG